MGKKLEMHWDCSGCGAKANLGRYRNCPSCGRLRGASTKFYTIEEDKYVPSSQVPQGPDWFCECCDSYNTYSAGFCTSCGAPKGASKDYFDINRDTQRPKASQYGTKGIDTRPQDNVRPSTSSSRAHDNNSAPTSKYTPKKEPNISTTVSRREYHPSDEPSYPPKMTYSTGHVEHTDNRSSAFSNIFSIVAENAPKILIVLLAMALIAGIVYLFLPKDVDLNVTSLTWKREIRIEEYKTVRESGWSVPAGGRVVYTNREIRDYEPIYERRAVQKSETYIKGYKTVKDITDLGNGYADVEEHEEPIYDTRYYTDYEDVIVGYEPIYDTKYYYDIERWIYSRTATSSGDRNTPYSLELASSNERDKSTPYWPETHLKSNEREKGRTEYYYVLGYNVNDKKQAIKQYDISYDLWNSITPQSTIKAVVQLGMIKEIKVE